MYYDFDEGGLFFISTNQLTANSDTNGDHSAYTLIVLPDFLLSYPLAKKIKQYGWVLSIHSLSAGCLKQRPIFHQ